MYVLTLAQVMACCLTATSHYLNQCWLGIVDINPNRISEKMHEKHLQSNVSFHGFFARRKWKWCKENNRILTAFLLPINLQCIADVNLLFFHDDVIKWKHFPRYWPFVRRIHRSPVNSPKGQWRGALMFSLIFAWINGWTKNREAGDLRRHLTRNDVTVIVYLMAWS